MKPSTFGISTMEIKIVKRLIKVIRLIMNAPLGIVFTFFISYHPVI